jgi:basic amino acid/polyamine antiporter, APA family
VTIHAGYATPLAIGVAAIAYVLTGLSYAELSSVYATAGGSATFAQQAFGDPVSFVSGWMLCLDYVVTSAIFAIPAIAYLSYFAPFLKEPYWLGIGAIILLVGLLILNVIGIKESVNFTLGLCLLDIASEVALVTLGLVLVVIPGGLLFKWPSLFSLGGSGPTGVPWSEFVQGITLAMVSYLGIEALAQAAEETKIAGRTIPRATMLTLGAVVILYLLISTVAVNIVPPNLLATTWKDDPLSGVARSLPNGAALVMAPMVAILGCTISIIGANAGIIGSSRTLYALARYKLLPGKFGAIHQKFRTPHIALLAFGIVSIGLVAVSSFGALGGAVDPLVLLGSLYNVGALLAYMQTHASLIATRNTDKARFRPFKVPLSFHIRGVEIPILAVLGMLATGAIWVAVIITHELGRDLGAVWVVVGMSLYIYYRRKNNLPVWRRAEPLHDSAR